MLPPTSAADAIRPLNAAVNHKSNKMLHTFRRRLLIIYMSVCVPVCVLWTYVQMNLN